MASSLSLSLLIQNTDLMERSHPRFGLHHHRQVSRLGQQTVNDLTRQRANQRAD